MTDFLKWLLIALTCWLVFALGQEWQRVQDKGNTACPYGWNGYHYENDGSYTFYCQTEPTPKPEGVNIK